VNAARASGLTPDNPETTTSPERGEEPVFGATITANVPSPVPALALYVASCTHGGLEATVQRQSVGSA